MCCLCLGVSSLFRNILEFDEFLGFSCDRVASVAKQHGVVPLLCTKSTPGFKNSVANQAPPQKRTVQKKFPYSVESIALYKEILFAADLWAQSMGLKPNTHLPE